MIGLGVTVQLLITGGEVGHHVLYILIKGRVAPPDIGVVLAPQIVGEEMREIPCIGETHDLGFPRLKPDALAQAGHRIGAGCRLFAVELTIRLHLVEERPDCLPSRGISRIARRRPEREAAVAEARSFSSRI